MSKWSIYKENNEAFENYLDVTSFIPLMRINICTNNKYYIVGTLSNIQNKIFQRK